MNTTYRELFKLYDLIQCGDACYVKRYLQECSININSVLPCKGIGVLHLAVGIEPQEKSKTCTEILLKNGGDPNLSTDDGVTPLHIAAIWGRVDNLKMLIGCGGDPFKRDLDGHSAFDYAAREQQWDVYDYLHDIIDDKEDSFGSDIAYSFDINKILVTTDQMVAEYEPNPDKIHRSHDSTRKSQIVRDWCDKTTLIMNKLYPTILRESHDLYDSKESMDEHNNAINLSTETKSSYKTCLSNPVSTDVEISGIEPLETTEEFDKKIASKRLSVYQNFSLPGSPTNITHKNYNSKTSLRKKFDSVIEEFDKISLDSSKSDNSVQLILDKAMEVVQNKTNEWICNKDEVRRLSASSGVSSAMSSGNITVANICEEYKYKDVKEDVVLIEKRMLLSSVVLPVEDTNSSIDQTIVSIASSLPSSVEMDNITLRTELLKLGFSPGPIDSNTKTLYLKKLRTLKKNPILTVAESGKTYSVELEKTLRDPTWCNDLKKYRELENKVRLEFGDPTKKWRQGTSKTSFTYLLLDPRITNNLPSRANHMSQHEVWKLFVASVFYVGKGKRSRPYSHLYQALTLWKGDFKTSTDKKVQHILDIWSKKVGVICLHIFQNVIPVEAFTHEAAMIDVLTLNNLKNKQSGTYYGVVSDWPTKDKHMLGLYLLYKAMLIFLSEGERQLRPGDID